MKESIKRVSLKNFRNHTEIDLALSDCLIIVGENGIGKTNIIEAIQLLTTLKTFRNAKNDELILKGKNNASLYALIDNKGVETELEIIIKEDGKTFKVNRKKRRKGDFVGFIPSVLFHPENLEIVKGSDSVRREEIDTTGFLISEAYRDICENYQSIVKQKNKLLKEDILDIELLDSFNSQLLQYGGLLMKKRLNLFFLLNEILKKVYSALEPKLDIEMFYIPSYIENENCENIIKQEVDHTLLLSNLKNAIEEKEEEEKIRGISLIGPHRDKVRISIGGLDSRRFASQGQTRTIVLALKIAEVELIRKLLKKEPILLLDDVMSELDDKHREALLVKIKSAAQTIITTTSVENIPKELLKEAILVEM